MIASLLFSLLLASPLGALQGRHSQGLVQEVRMLKIERDRLARGLAADPTPADAQISDAARICGLEAEVSALPPPPDAPGLRRQGYRLEADERAMRPALCVLHELARAKRALHPTALQLAEGRLTISLDAITFEARRGERGVDDLVAQRQALLREAMDIRSLARRSKALRGAAWALSAAEPLEGALSIKDHALCFNGAVARPLAQRVTWPRGCGALEVRPPAPTPKPAPLPTLLDEGGPLHLHARRADGDLLRLHLDAPGRPMLVRAGRGIKISGQIRARTRKAALEALIKVEPRLGREIDLQLIDPSEAKPIDLHLEALDLEGFARIERALNREPKIALTPNPKPPLHLAGRALAWGPLRARILKEWGLVERREGGALIFAEPGVEPRPAEAPEALSRRPEPREALLPEGARLVAVLIDEEARRRSAFFDVGEPAWLKIDQPRRGGRIKIEPGAVIVTRGLEGFEVARRFAL